MIVSSVSDLRMRVESEDMPCLSLLSIFIFTQAQSLTTWHLTRDFDSERSSMCSTISTLLDLVKSERMENSVKHNHTLTANNIQHMPLMVKVEELQTLHSIKTWSSIDTFPPKEPFEEVRNFRHISTTGDFSRIYQTVRKFMHFLSIGTLGMFPPQEPFQTVRNFRYFEHSLNMIPLQEPFQELKNYRHVYSKGTLSMFPLQESFQELRNFSHV